MRYEDLRERDGGLLPLTPCCYVDSCVCNLKALDVRRKHASQYNRGAEIRVYLLMSKTFEIHDIGTTMISWSLKISSNCGPRCFSVLVIGCVTGDFVCVWGLLSYVNP